MPKFKKKPVVIEAITFAEFVQYGKDNGGNIVNGMPWSFEYKCHGITHENDQTYLIPTLEGIMKFTPDDMLITGVNGEIYPCKLDIFDKTYELVGDDQAQDKGNISDGYHTFNELYEHRHALFINVVNANPNKSFKTLRNDSGEQWDGWFIAGINTRFGQMTYHLPIAYWGQVNAIEVACNSDYDGHSSADVVERLLALAAE